MKILSRIEAYNPRYRRAVWISPDGQRLVGKLPQYQQGQNFGAKLRQFIIYQHHHCQVTQPLIHEQLTEIGVDISTSTAKVGLTFLNYYTPQGV